MLIIGKKGITAYASNLSVEQKAKLFDAYLRGADIDNILQLHIAGVLNISVEQGECSIEDEPIDDSEYDRVFDNERTSDNERTFGEYYDEGYGERFVAFVTASIKDLEGCVNYKTLHPLLLKTNTQITCVLAHDTNHEQDFLHVILPDVNGQPKLFIKNTGFQMFKAVQQDLQRGVIADCIGTSNVPDYYLPCVKYAKHIDELFADH